jgi:DNA (cytosine-5)-methyltransferase 1
VKIGSLFSGYGGLDMAVQSVYGGDLAWYSEIEPAACTVLAAHHPGVPNLGDITAVDWSQVEPVDILTGGYPCQPFSHAGQRKGKNDERHLWPYVCAAIDALRPRLVVLENVRGHLTLGFGDVLADLSRVGYDATWGVVRASDTGAPHGRARIFIAAYPDSTRLEGAGADVLLPGRGAASGLAAPSDMGAAAESVGERHDGIGDCSGESLAECGRPDAAGFAGAPARTNGGRHSRGVRTDQPPAEPRTAWGKYEPAIRRWERLTRPAPEPTIPGNNGRPRLSPLFVEWMMGLPAGHVTGHGLRPAQELKMLGNGVVPQQAELALRLLAS